jgi:lipopolysaccharide export system permease protein
VIMSAAGMSPWRIFRPFFSLTLLVSLVIGIISVQVAPQCLRLLRYYITQVRADLIASIIQPGKFTTIENGLTFHVQNRDQNGLLQGVLMRDARNPKLSQDILAERGEIITSPAGTFLVLEHGTIQRRTDQDRDPSIVNFNKYAFDLSQFLTETEVDFYKPREKYIFELLSPDQKDPYWQHAPGQFRSELHDRLSTPLYPIAFLMLAFTFLGQPRTTRQSRALAMALTVSTIVLVRIAGFAASTFAAKSAGAVFYVYAIPLSAILFGAYGIHHRIEIGVPRGLITFWEAFSGRFMRPQYGDPS